MTEFDVSSTSVWFCLLKLLLDNNVAYDFQVDTNELYDVVNYNTKQMSGVSVQALRTLWDQKSDHHSHMGTNQRIQQQNDPPAVQPPILPPKSTARKLTGTVSVDAMSLSQVSWTLEVSFLKNTEL